MGEGHGSAIAFGCSAGSQAPALALDVGLGREEAEGGSERRNTAVGLGRQATQPACQTLSEGSSEARRCAGPGAGTKPRGEKGPSRQRLAGAGTASRAGAGWRPALAVQSRGPAQRRPLAARCLVHSTQRGQASSWGRSERGSVRPMGRATGRPVLWSLLSFIIYFGKSVDFRVRSGFRSYYACHTGCVTLRSHLASLSPHLRMGRLHRALGAVVSQAERMRVSSTEHTKRILFPFPFPSRLRGHYLP